MNFQRIAHKLTAYHWRYDRNRSTVLVICDCGWHSRVMRTPLKRKLRRLVCFVRGHQWGEVETASFGPIDHDSEDPTKPDPDMEWESRQCDFCYHVEDL